MERRTETIHVEGMSCGHCVRAVREALEETEGVEVEEVRIGTVRLRYDPEQTDRAEIGRVIEEAGYTVVG